MVYLISLAVALVAAFIGSLVGLGGGVIMIPVLLFLHYNFDAFMWATPQVIVGMSLISIVFTAISSAASYYRNDRIHIRIGLYFLIGSIPGGILGSWLNQFINSDLFSAYFGFLMIALSFLFMLKREKQSERHTKTPIVSIIIISLIVGILSGLFGIGGGAIIVPVLIFLFGLSVHTAAATSMFIIVFSSIVSAGTHIILGHIMWQYVLFFIIGSWLGGKLGAKVNQLVRNKTLEWILRLMLIIIGIRLVIEGLT